jgi:hypothetical protein
MKNAVFLDVAPCVRLSPVNQLLTILFTGGFCSTMKMEAIRSSETSVLTRPTRRHVPEDGIHHSHSCGNVRSSKHHVSWQYPSNGLFYCWRI